MDSDQQVVNKELSLSRVQGSGLGVCLAVVVQIRQLQSGKELGHTKLVSPEREFFIDNLLVRIHFIIVMIRWTGLGPWGFELPSTRNPTTRWTSRVPLPQNVEGYVTKFGPEVNCIMVS